MGLFNKLFGQKVPAPKVQIHPDDANLIKQADLQWWDSLSLDNVKSFEEQDNLFRVVALRNYIENEGLTNEDAAKKVRKSFIFFYSTLEERNNDSFGFHGEDAKLPYVLKDRANRAIPIIKNMNTLERESASSMNAIVRNILRSK